MSINVNRPRFIARKSMFPAFDIGGWWLTLLLVPISAALFFFLDLPLWISLFFLIIPIVAIAVNMIELRCQYVIFYDNYVVLKRGVFRKIERRMIFPRVVTCTVDRRFYQRILGYGRVVVDTIGGQWDIADELVGIKRPLMVRRFIESHFILDKDVDSMKQTVITG